MKRHLLTLLLVGLCALTASAHDFESDGIYYNITSYSDLTVEVTYRGDSPDAYSDEYLGMVTIPSTVSYEGDTYRVTDIGGDAFNGCITLIAINIPEGVMYIGDAAFHGCCSLTAIIIPEGVTYIGWNTFEGCSSLKGIIIPEGVTSIGNEAFYGCSSLTAINIPENSQLTSIESDAVSGCSSLKSITIPEGVTSIGGYAFYGCSSLTAVHISSLEAWCNIDFSTLYSNPLYYAKNLYINGELVTEFTIPNSATAIKDYAFYGCSSLKSITIPDGVTSIGRYAFCNCSSLTAINIPDGVTSIGMCAFYNCSSLTAINIPESVTSIGSSAFYDCSILKSITIPENSQLTSIGSDTFRDCSSLKSITIPEGVTSIGQQAFCGCSSLTAINIPEGVTSIESSTFSGCSSLKSITIPENSQLTSIGNAAFYDCSSLTAINIPEGVTSIGYSAFYGCSSLTAINIPEGVTSIGTYAFYLCNSLTAIYCYAESVPATGESVFGIYTYYDATLYVPQSAMASYQSTAPWSSFRIKKLPMVPGDQVTDLSDLSNDKVYTLRSARAFLLHSEAEQVADKLCSNTGGKVGAVEYALGNPALHFRIEKKGDNYYLYSVGAGKYVDADGNYEAQANTVLKMENVGGDYPWKLCLGNHGMNTQVPGQTNEGIMVNWWTTTDVGNCYQIIEAVTPLITLSEYVATLTETKTMTLTATVKPAVIAHEAVTWSSSNPSVATVDAATGVVTAVTPGTATITASLYGVTASCKLTVDRLILGTCSAPIISYVDGQVQLDCATPDVQYVANMKSDNLHTIDFEEQVLDFVPSYTITAYATKRYYLDSETTTVTLCWIACEEDHEEEEDQIEVLAIPSRPVLISTQGGTITISGLAEGTEVAVFTINSTQVASATATGDTLTLATDLEAGTIVIVKMGESSVKLMIK